MDDVEKARELHRTGAIDEARQTLREYLADHPHKFDAWLTLAVIEHQAGRGDAALDAIARADALQPDNAKVAVNRGAILQAAGRYADALACFDKILERQPDFAEIHSNRGIVLHALGRYGEARAAFERAIDLKPDHAPAWSNLGLALQELGDRTGMRDSLDRALAINPDYDHALWNRSLYDLRAGNYTDGWRGYERRWSQGVYARFRRAFAQPQWTGREDLKGKTILLYAEQGYGDTLQFCRYAPLLADRGATVLLQVQPPLKTLLTGLKGVAGVYAEGETLPPFDYQCPMLSLPHVCGTTVETVPADIPYLRTPVDRTAPWRDAAGGGDALRIGIAWSGNPAHRNDRNRSIGLERFAALAAPGRRLVAVQRDVTEADAAFLNAHPVVAAPGAALKDFADTAALMENLDVVISVDSAPAHLAGATGRPVWVLLPYIADWRWMDDRVDSPWYPNARLFRQPVPGDWDSVFESLKTALHSLFPTGRGPG